MNSLTPVKRKQLFGMLVGVVCFVAFVWYLVIQPQHAKLKAQQVKIDEVRGDVATAKRNFGMLGQFEGDFKVSQQELQSQEDKMASGDVYRWMLHIFEDLQTTNRVTLFNIDPPRLSESEIPPQIPYRTATFSVSGTAHYHDFGVFLAALENDLPFLRLQKLELKRGTSFVDTGSDDREQLSFSIELLTLAKVASVQP